MYHFASLRPKLRRHAQLSQGGTESKLYLKSDKLIVQFNDGATVRYKYLTLGGTGATWSETTTPP